MNFEVEAGQYSDTDEDELRYACNSLIFLVMLKN